METTSIVLLSGGIDSAVCLALSCEQGHDPTAVFVAYGQPAEAAERRASCAVADHYGASWRELRASLTNEMGAGAIPHRNLLLISIAMASVRDTPLTVTLGIHDGMPYPDCSAGFLTAIQSVLDVTCGGGTVISAPLLDRSKAEILAYADRVRLPLSLTWSCEVGSRVPCGTCLSCLDRSSFE